MRLSGRWADIDGRILVVAALTFYLGVVAGARWLFNVDLWPWFGVGSGPTLFYDARNVAAAADCWDLGYDPLEHNPCDPTGRVMNYPRVWLLLHFVGVTQERTVIFGTLVLLLFAIALLALVGRVSAGHGAVIALAVTSPAVMFAVERGNMDLVVFAMFVVAVLSWRERARLTPWLSPAVVLAAATTKYYAALALPAYLVAPDRRVRWAVPAAVCLMAAYLAVTADDVRASARAPEGGRTGSFGARILIGWAYHRMAPAGWGRGNLLAQAAAVAVLAGVAAVAWLYARRHIERLPVTALGSHRVLAFHLGALTFLGTFAIRRNGDYRLVFLLLALPALLNWAVGTAAPRRRVLARATLVAIIARLWLGGLSEHITPVHELASWASAALLIALLAGSVPALPTLFRRRHAAARVPAS